MGHILCPNYQLLQTFLFVSLFFVVVFFFFPPEEALIWYNPNLVTTLFILVLADTRDKAPSCFLPLACPGERPSQALWLCLDKCFLLFCIQIPQTSHRLIQNLLSLSIFESKVYALWELSVQGEAGIEATWRKVRERMRKRRGRGKGRKGSLVHIFLPTRFLWNIFDC